MIEVESATLERHARLYLADGDVVLAARQPESHQEAHSQYQVYRVHKAILCLHSPVFANVLSDAMPGLGESYDGAPLVEMVGDEAPAFSSLLMWLYFPLEMTIERWDPDTPITVALVVRLASKYLVDTLRSHLVNTVVADWPRTLEEWNRQEAEIRAMRSDRASSMKRDNFSRLVPEPAAAIAFALEFGCTEILLAAFYTLSCISITNDWDRAAPHALDSYLRLAGWSMLESRELLRFMRGCDALEKYCDEKRTRPDIAMKRILDAHCRLEPEVFKRWYRATAHAL
ncbi:hypothetical protein C8T65DRAFT_744940 [Cerioporus squamosus]|nr:hypothetical protein C8T65DRAFT_744940 [Cerioporus squamosus]